MNEQSAKLPSPAGKTIEMALEEFLADQRARLKSKTMRNYEDVVRLFQDCMNGYAYQELDDEEEAMFRRFYDAAGQRHREFCQVFGPEKIPENVGEFLNYFMVRKVMCGKAFLRSAGTVMRKLGKWLRQKGYVDEDDADVIVDQGAEAARNLPVAENLAEMLMDYAGRTAPDCEHVREDYFTIDAVESGKLHLSSLSSATKIAVPVSREISEVCSDCIGWTISGAVGKGPQGWRLLEAWNVYP